MSLALSLATLLSSGCERPLQETAETAIARSRNSPTDQVSAVGQGVPFFSQQTLNPVWQSDSSTPIVKIPILELIDQHGKHRTEAMFEQKFTILAFMFTSCSGFCPFIMQRMKKIHQTLKTRDDVQYVAITVDPEVDKPDQLKKFIAAQSLEEISPLILLTGEEKTILALARDTLASQVLRKPDKGPRDFVHSGHLYVFDTKARLRGILNGTEIEAPLAASKLLQRL